MNASALKGLHYSWHLRILIKLHFPLAFIISWKKFGTQALYNLHLLSLLLLLLLLLYCVVLEINWLALSISQ